jgi:transposase-like protein
MWVAIVNQILKDVVRHQSFLGNSRETLWNSHVRQIYLCCHCGSTFVLKTDKQGSVVPEYSIILLLPPL